MATHVLIASHDVVGYRMAGPGIRYWELARVLSASCDVTLAVPWRSDLRADEFAVRTYRPGDWDSLQDLARQADVIMPCGFVLHQFLQLTRLGRPIVIDGYDPYPAESVSLVVDRTPKEQTIYQRGLIENLHRECQAGDFFLCASEQQRLWWLGMLAATGRLNPWTFGADATLRTLVDVVPFGCPSEPPLPTGPVLKGVHPGIGPHDRVVLWGGGIWEWLDPLTLLRAVARVVARRPEVKLLFPGTRHPNDVVPDMPMRHRAVELAGELGLAGRHVFFGDWVPRPDWPNYLLEADVGVCLHFDSLETELAFRSRVLDYVWAGLPVLVTRGGATAELVSGYDLGLVVDYQNTEEVAAALVRLLDEPRNARRDRFAAARAALCWERAAGPLVRFCRSPYRAADHPIPWV
ncbi:MAG: glycosyltransferase family 4 protein [Anaerolineae bacterium]